MVYLVDYRFKIYPNREVIKIGDMEWLGIKNEKVYRF